MSDRAPGWVVPVMRAGYAARAIVYVVIGVLALLAAWRGGSAESTTGALDQLRQAGWGALLWVIGIGLLAYAVWRAIDAWMDLDRHGTDAKGIVARLGLAVTAALHLALGLYALGIGVAGGVGGGGSGGGGGQSAQDWTAKLMAAPFGRWLVAAAGLIVIGAGVYYVWKGYSEKFKGHLRLTRVTERLTPFCRFGLYAHGTVVMIVGGFLVWAAWTSDPSDAGGLGQAFAAVRGAAFGRVLLGILALGMLGFAVYCMIEAVYRIVPRRAGDDVETLARRAKRQAEAQVRSA